MTPDGLPALSVPETSQRPRAMAMVGMPRFPTACLPLPCGPQTLLCPRRSSALCPPSLSSPLPTSSLPILSFLRALHCGGL